MSRNSPEGSELVVVELGAAWPTTLVASRGGCRVVAEIEGEGPLGFAARVDDFIAGAFPRSAFVVRAVLACNLRADQTAEAARRAVAESLLSRLGANGVLTFCASQRAGDRFRRRLGDLVAELGGPAGSGRVQAHLGDEEAARGSGPRTSDATAEAASGVARVA
ncbi:MAG TPA: hypothetical protein VNN72_06835 [Polyangiaceae bacterium]|jgi:hypothetical protein|nr:hypothetical protein [Polyangiaceae bacterium]